MGVGAKCVGRAAPGGGGAAAHCRALAVEWHMTDCRQIAAAVNTRQAAGRNWQPRGAALGAWWRSGGACMCRRPPLAGPGMRFGVGAHA